MSANKLALLTDKTQHFHPAPGGIPMFTQDDVAGALGMIKQHDAALFGRIKYAKQTEYIKKLEKAVTLDIRWMGIEKQWRIHKKGICRSLARLAIVEHVNPMRCFRCKGVGERMVRNVRVECPTCFGTKRFRLTRRMYCEALGIDKHTWDRLWRERYRCDILPILDKYEAVLAGQLNKQLKTPW